MSSRKADSTKQPGPRRSGWNNLLLSLVGWAAFWIVLAVITYIVVSVRKIPLLPTVLIVVCEVVTALGSLGLAYPWFNQWQGRIEEIRNESVQVPNGDGWRGEEKPIAYVREVNGRIRRIGADSDWQVGDVVEKRRGEARPRKIAM